MASPRPRGRCASLCTVPRSWSASTRRRSWSLIRVRRSPPSWPGSARRWPCATACPHGRRRNAPCTGGPTGSLQQARPAMPSAGPRPARIHGSHGRPGFGSAVPGQAARTRRRDLPRVDGRPGRGGGAQGDLGPAWRRLLPAAPAHADAAGASAHRQQPQGHVRPCRSNDISQQHVEGVGVGVVVDGERDEAGRWLLGGEFTTEEELIKVAGWRCTMEVQRWTRTLLSGPSPAPTRPWARRPCLRAMLAGQPLPTGPASSI